MSDPIPFLDLISPHRELESELMAVMKSALNSAGFIGGPLLQKFERNFAAFVGSTECIGVSNGTDALRFALVAAGVKPGDTVLTVANTFIATAEAITQAGAHPEFIDVDEDTYNMSPESLRAYLSECALDVDTGLRLGRRTGMPITAVLPVHLYGQMADMDPIEEIAEEFRLALIEDACQAHGAEYFSRRQNRWRKAGSIGKAAAFSFYPGKNLGACGDAGAVTTSDPRIAQEIRKLRDHGSLTKYYHDVVGYNGRLDSIQAGFLDIKLRHLAAWNELRRAAAARFNAMFEAVPGVIAPFEPANSRAVYHLYVVRVSHRQLVQEALAKAGIGTGIHYPVPVHLQKAYAELGYKKGDLPVTESFAGDILSLPMFPGITLQAQQRVVEQLAGVTASLPREDAAAFAD